MHEILHGLREFVRRHDDPVPLVQTRRQGTAASFAAFFTDVQIEDLWLPYFCVSANLNRAELKVHTTGSLADAVLASSRAPGIFPPVVMDGELHVDGGLINNVPVDVMKIVLEQGMVIGVDVSPPHELNQIDDYGHDVSGWRAIWHRFNPTRHKRVYRPSILLVLMRVIEFGGHLVPAREGGERGRLHLAGAAAVQAQRFSRRRRHRRSRLSRVARNAAQVACECA